MCGRTASSALFPVHRRRASRSAHHTWDSELATRRHLKAFRRNENLPLRNHSNEMLTRMDHSGRKKSKSSRTAIFALVGRADHFARRGIDLDRMGVSLVVTRLQDAVTHATQSGHRLRMRLSQ
jgi:hypothetical protein